MKIVRGVGVGRTDRCIQPTDMAVDCPRRRPYASLYLRHLSRALRRTSRPLDATRPVLRPFARNVGLWNGGCANIQIDRYDSAFATTVAYATISQECPAWSLNALTLTGCDAPP